MENFNILFHLGLFLSVFFVAQGQLLYSDTEEVDYEILNGNYCGGSSINSWDDGSSADWDVSGIPECKKICSEHSECTGFNHNTDIDMELYGNRCGFWKTGPISGYSNSRFNCYKKIIECGNCYGAKDDGCCNTCEEVKEAYDAKWWTYGSFIQCKPVPEYYVDDGCHNETGHKDDVTGSYQQESSKAHVRCCKMDGSECSTLSYCKNDLPVTFAEAADQCGEIDATNPWRLCTKDELLSDICCQTGGKCDNFAIWTSTLNPDQVCKDIDSYASCKTWTETTKYCTIDQYVRKNCKLTCGLCDHYLL